MTWGAPGGIGVPTRGGHPGSRYVVRLAYRWFNALTTRWSRWQWPDHVSRQRRKTALVSWRARSAVRPSPGRHRSAPTVGAPTAWQGRRARAPKRSAGGKRRHRTDGAARQLKPALRQSWSSIATPFCDSYSRMESLRVRPWFVALRHGSTKRRSWPQWSSRVCLWDTTRGSSRRKWPNWCAFRLRMAPSGAYVKRHYCARMWVNWAKSSRSRSWSRGSAWGVEPTDSAPYGIIEGRKPTGR